MLELNLARHYEMLVTMKCQFVQSSQTIWILPLLLSLLGCGAESQAQSSASPAAIATSSVLPAEPTAELKPSELNTELNTEPNTELNTADLPDAQPDTQPEIQQDYAPTQPLPSTGKVTIRADIRSLALERLIADCPTDSSPYAFAESSNYQVQICSAEYDPWQPKYYIGQSKASAARLEITSTDPDAARQLIFKHADYTYIIYRDSARPELNNAYLEIYPPGGAASAEALLYLYEMEPPR